MKKLIVLHGALGSSDQLQPLVNILSKHFEVYPMEFSGHGQTPFTESFGIQQFTSDLKKFIDNNHLEGVDIVGYSMGGYVALNLARNDSRIGKIVTLGTKFGWNPESSRKEITHLIPDRMEEKVPHFAKALNDRHANWKKTVTATADMMLALGENPILTSSTLSQIKNEVLVMLADNDKMVSPEETHEAVDAIRNARFNILPNSAHPIEKIDLKELTDQIISFLRN